MKINKNILTKYAKLAVEMGANVQKDQYVVISSAVSHHEFVELLVDEAYKAGAKNVLVNWSDEEITRMAYENQSIETLSTIPAWTIDRYKYFIDNKACFIHVDSRVPGILDHIPSEKLQASTIASSKAMEPYRYYTMANHGQWTIVALPNVAWAKKIFKDKSEEDALQALWDNILKMVYISEDNDPVEEWKKHNSDLKKYYTFLNNENFKTLHFKNELGTDLYVDLVIDHIWRGGQDFTLSNIPFNPNMPSEEVFTMPKRDGVNGVVYATKPLNYQGKIIKDFWIKFKDGKAIEYGAKENVEALKNLIDLDEGSSYLGEVALISFDTPISMSNILFYNTLFDENASCHLALGASYPTNLKNGENMSDEERLEKGSNVSMTHVDFMFGSKDMDIVGIKFDGSTMQIFKDGNFVI